MDLHYTKIINFNYLFYYYQILYNPNMYSFLSMISTVIISYPLPYASILFSSSALSYPCLSFNITLVFNLLLLSWADELVLGWVDIPYFK